MQRFSPVSSDFATQPFQTNSTGGNFSSVNAAASRALNNSNSLGQDPLRFDSDEVAASPPVVDIDQSLEAFAQLHGDALIKQTEYEGKARDEVPALFSALFTAVTDSDDLTDEEKRSLRDVIPAFKADLDQIGDFERAIESKNATTISRKFFDAMSRLREGASLTLPIGWNGERESGHRMLLQITKNRNQFDITLINAGTGSEFHVSGLHGFKKKIVPIMVFKNVPTGLLSEDFFFSLATRLTVEPLLQSKKEIQGAGNSPSTMIYATILGKLSPYRSKNKHLVQELVTSQRSGGSLVKGIQALLGVRLREQRLSPKLYKKLVFLIRSLSLSAFYTKNKGSLSSTETKDLQTRALLQEACKNLMTRGLKGITKNDVEHDLIQKRCAWVKTIVSEIQNKEAKIEETQFSYRASPEIERDSFEIRIPFHSLDKRDTICSLDSQPLRFFNEITTNNVLDCAKTCLVSSRQLKNDPESAKRQIELLIEKLPLDRNHSIWNGLDAASEKELLKTILALQSDYIFLLDEEYTLVSEQNTILSFFALAHLITERIEARLSNDVPKVSKLFTFNLAHVGYFSTPRWFFSSENEEKRRKEIMDYYEKSIPVPDELTDLDNIQWQSKLEFNSEDVDTEISKNTFCNAIFSSRYNRELLEFTERSERLLDPSKGGEEPVDVKARAFCRVYTDYTLERENSFFAHKEWDHMVHLRKAAWLTKYGMGKGSVKKECWGGIRSPDFNICFTRHESNVFKKPFESNTIYFQNTDEKKVRNVEEYTTEPCISGPEKEKERSPTSRLELKSPLQTYRRGLEWLSEKLGPDSKNVNLQEILAIYSINEPDLRLDRLLNFFKAHMNLFEEKKYQYFFLEQFFKSMITERRKDFQRDIIPGTIEVPFDLSRWNSEGFRENLIGFLREGKKSYNYLTDLKAKLFFVKVARMVLPYYKDNAGFFQALENEIVESDTALEEASLPKEKKSLVHIERLLYYKTLYELDRNAFFSKQAAISKCLESFLYINRFAPLKSDIEKHEVRLVRKFTAEVFSPESGFPYNCIKTDLSQILRRVHFNVPDDSKWVQDGRNPFIFHLDGLYSVNLQKGALAKAGEGEIGFNLEVDKIYASKNYKELAGDQKVDLYKSGDYVHFELYGKEFRFKFQLYYGNLEIECNFDGNWGTFVSNENKNTANLPSFMLADHNQFKLSIPDNRIGNQDRLYLTNKKGEIEYIVSSGRGVEKFESGQIVSLIYEVQPIDRFKNIESSEYVFIELNKTTLESFLTFPRIAAGAKPLRFVAQNSMKPVYRYEKDPLYSLELDPPKGLLGAFKNYLLLKDEDKNYMALIPDEPYSITAAVPLSGGSLLDSQTKNDEERNKVTRPQQMTRSYFTIPLNKGELAPRNDEELLFSAYLMLGQKEYLKAITFLKKVSPSVFFTKKCERILTQIAELSIISQDHSVYATAIYLHALLLKTQVKKMQGESEFSSSNEVDQKRLQYVQEISRVPTYLRLSRNEELEILNLGWVLPSPVLDKQLIEQRKSFLRGEKIDRNLAIFIDQEEKPITFTVGTGGIKIPTYSGPSYSEGISLQTLCEKEGNLSNSEFWQMYDDVTTALGEKKVNLRFQLQEAITLLGGKATNAIFFYNLLMHNDAKDPFPRYSGRTNEDEIRWQVDIQVYYGISSFSRAEILVGDICDRAKEDGSDRLETAALDLVQFPFTSEEIEETLFPKLTNATQTPWITRLERIKSQIQQLGVSQRPQDFEDDIDGIQRNVNRSDFGTLATAIELSVDEFKKGYQKSAKRRKEELVLSQLDDFTWYIKSLEDNLKSAKREFEEHKKELEELANNTNDLVHRLECLAGVRKTVDLKDLAYLLIHRKLVEYETVMPHLKGNRRAIERVCNTTADTLYLGIKLRELETLLNRLQSANTTKQESDLKEVIAATFEGTSYLEYEERPSLLSFEFSRGVTFRKTPDQVKTITHMDRSDDNDVNNYASALSQVVMGGGKTSVLIANLLAIRNGIPILVTPAFQFSTIYQSIRKTLRECFNVETVAIDYTKDKLTLDVLSNIEEILLSILNGPLEGKRKVLVICPEMVQMIELEFLSRISELKNKVEHKKIDPKLIKLFNILQLLRNHGNAVGDEVQTLFDINKEVNFSLGTPLNIERPYLDLLKEIFKIFAKKEILLKGKMVSLEDLLQLRKNQQKYLPEGLFESVIVPEVAKLLASEYAPLGLFEDPLQKERFARYVTDKMDGNIERVLANKTSINDLHLSSEDRREFESDKDFIESLRGIAASNDREVSIRADLIALTKHLLRDVLPSTLTRMGNIKYGRTKDRTKAGKVKPYQSASNESTTEFASHYEAAALHFATALHYGIDPDQFLFIAKQFHQDAKKFEPLSASYEETPPAQFFEKLTGVLPNRAEENASETLSKLNQKEEDILTLESMSIEKFVEYYPRRVSSNAHSLFSMFRSFTATGGTIDPFVLPIPMQKDAESRYEDSIDLLINPEIIHALLEKGDQDSVFTIKTEENKVEKSAHELFDKMLNHGADLDKISSIIDAGGVFKNFDPIEIGNSLLEVLKTAQPGKKGVLLYSRSEGSTIANQFTFVRKKEGEEGCEWIPLEDTSKEELKKYDLKPGDYVSFYDQRHCLGTDILQPGDGIGILTLDKGITTDGACQAIMRLRQFLLGQKVRIAVPEHIASKIVSTENRGNLLDHIKRREIKPALLSIIFELIRSQAVIRANDIYRTYSKALSNAFYQFGLQSLFDAFKGGDFDDIISCLETVDSLLYLVTEDNPFELFGGLTEEIDVIESLNRNISQMRAKLPTKLQESQSKMLEKLNGEIDAILAQAQKSIDRMRSVVATPVDVVSSATKDAIGTVLEVTVEQVAEVEQEMDMSIEQELQRELGLYQSKTKLIPRKPRVWEDTEIFEFLNDIRSGRNSGEMSPLRDHLTQEKGYLKNYQELFDGNLFVTSYAIQPYEQRASIFDQQMPPFDFLLCMKDRNGNSIGVLLEASEANAFKLYLKKNQHQFPDTHLMMGGKEVVAGNFDTVNLKDESLRRLIFQLNFLGCNSKYILRDLEEYLAYLEETPGETCQLKLNFLKLRGLNDSDKKSIVNEYLINVEKVKDLISYQKRLSDKPRDVATIQSLSPADVDNITPSEVAYLRNDQIRYVKKAALLKHLKGVQIEHVPNERIKNLSNGQMAWIQKRQIQFIKEDPACVAAIPTALFATLEVSDLGRQADFILRHLKKDQIERVTSKEILMRLPNDKLKLISKNHVPHFEGDKLKTLLKELDPQSDLFDVLSDQQMAAIDTFSDKELNSLPERVCRKIKTPATLAKIKKKEAPPAPPKPAAKPSPKADPVPKPAAPQKPVPAPKPAAPPKPEPAPKPAAPVKPVEDVKTILDGTPSTEAEKKISLLEANPQDMKNMKGVEKMAYVVVNVALSIFSVIFAIPVSIVHYGGKICRLNLLNAVHTFIYRNLRTVCKLGFYLITCCHYK